jgi:enoyl reductase-like protein
MRKFGNRTIKVNKQQLIDKIKENKAAHIEAYNKAVIAYKEEALKQLTELTTKANNGDLQLRLNLTTPINNSENYDKIVEMFTWEVEETVELEQKEFTEYVQDETDFAIMAKLSNTAYLHG